MIKTVNLILSFIIFLFVLDITILRRIQKIRLSKQCFESKTKKLF